MRTPHLGLNNPMYCKVKMNKTDLDFKMYTYIKLYKDQFGKNIFLGEQAQKLSKLSLYGIQESTYDWFKSYLNNRTQKCVVNSSLSKVCSLSCGVPQGTILGLLLFLIYINDLPNCLSVCQPRMLADDTHITYARADLHSIQSSPNRDLSEIHKWFPCNKLILNTTKTEFTLIVLDKN